jgi:hypothetical protein
MLQRSRTFRSLFHALSRRGDLRVLILLDDRATSDRAGRRAETTIRRSGARREATVLLFDPEHPVELIAHELEHVRENAEGLNLPLLASAHWPGIFRQWDGTFETRRAQETGQEVADESRLRPALPVDELRQPRVSPAIGVQAELKFGPTSVSEVRRTAERKLGATSLQAEGRRLRRASRGG